VPVPEGIVDAQFGSGWAWLVLENGKLAIKKTPNAENPITSGAKPILVMDVWEVRPGDLAANSAVILFMQFDDDTPNILRECSGMHSSCWSIMCSRHRSSLQTLYELTSRVVCCAAARVLPGRAEQAPGVHLHLRQRAHQLGQGVGALVATVLDWDAKMPGSLPS
jgi:Iron/manganese superoxide dismutases, C-terminal domain